MVFLVSSVVLMTSGSLVYGKLGLIAAASLAAPTIGAWWGSGSMRGAVPVVATLLGVLLVLGLFYAEVTMFNAVCLLMGLAVAVARRTLGVKWGPGAPRRCDGHDPARAHRPLGAGVSRGDGRSSRQSVFGVQIVTGMVALHPQPLPSGPMLTARGCPRLYRPHVARIGDVAGNNRAWAVHPESVV